VRNGNRVIGCADDVPTRNVHPRGRTGRFAQRRGGYRSLNRGEFGCSLPRQIVGEDGTDDGEGIPAGDASDAHPRIRARTPRRSDPERGTHSGHHISVRHLYNVLAAGGISLGDWIRERRLQACRDDLADASSRDLTIAAIARRWGFRDASNFGRLFRAESGLTPREWRNTAT
jgi:helix-turn-helix protein